MQVGVCNCRYNDNGSHADDARLRLHTLMINKLTKFFINLPHWNI